MQDIPLISPTDDQILRWRMRDGTEIALKDMEDSHIMNCIKMLERMINDDKERARQAREALNNPYYDNQWQRHHMARHADRMEVMSETMNRHGSWWINQFYQELLRRNGTQTIDGDYVDLSKVNLYINHERSRS